METPNKGLCNKGQSSLFDLKSDYKVAFRFSLGVNGGVKGASYRSEIRPKTRFKGPTGVKGRPLRPYPLALTLKPSVVKQKAQ